MIAAMLQVLLSQQYCNRLCYFWLCSLREDDLIEIGRFLASVVHWVNLDVLGRVHQAGGTLNVRNEHNVRAGLDVGGLVSLGRGQ